MNNRWFRTVCAVVVASTLMLAEARAADGLTLNLRSRDQKTGKATVTKAEWEPKKTALIICDMWDDHWCKSAAKRVGELAGPMNELIKTARAKGVFIIHAPSSVVAFYEGTPQRKLAQQAAFTRTKAPLADKERWGTKWSWPVKSREPELPIDDTDMGCDCATKCEIREAWKRQTPAIDILEGDAITDNGQETFNLLAERGIDQILMMGVHLNMCVLGRPFAIRELVLQGKQVALIRDMTDTMYNPEKKPQVSHFEGTRLVIKHVEQYWCPSILSTDITGAKRFRFEADRSRD